VPARIALRSPQGSWPAGRRVSVLPWPATGYIQGHSGSVSAQKPPLLAVPYGGVLDGGTHLQASARLVADIEEQAATSRKAGPVIREELTRLFTWEERHRRLAARLLIALGLTLLVLAVGSALIWVFESGVKGGGIHGYGDAAFFTAVQLLTISSAIANPLTAGKIVDVALEIWAIFVVTSIAGSFASFSAPATPARPDR
jgi:hypothetical protein